MRRNDDTPLGCYLIFFVIIFIVFAVSNCNDEKRNEEKQKDKGKLDQIQKEYLNRFDFNFEEIIENIENLNLQNIEKSTPKKPIIIFEKRTVDNKKIVFFNYQLNKKLDKEYVSFKNNEINTIVLISDTLINVGHYSRTEKIGFKNNIIITYIDKKTNKIIFKDEIEGEKPPEQIRYHENDESDKVYGKRPSELEIFEKIITNIK